MILYSSPIVSNIPCTVCGRACINECRLCGTPFCDKECYAEAQEYHVGECQDIVNEDLIGAALTYEAITKALTNEVTPFTADMLTDEAKDWNRIREIWEDVKLEEKLPQEVPALGIYGVPEVYVEPKRKTGLKKLFPRHIRYYVTSVVYKEAFSGTVGKMRCIPAIILVSTPGYGRKLAPEQKVVPSYYEAIEDAMRNIKSIKKQLSKIAKRPCDPKDKRLNTITSVTIPYDVNLYSILSLNRNVELLEHLIVFLIENFPRITRYGMIQLKESIVLYSTKAGVDPTRDERTRYIGVRNALCKKIPCECDESCFTNIVDSLLRLT